MISEMKLKKKECDHARPYINFQKKDSDNPVVIAVGYTEYCIDIDTAKRLYRELDDVLSEDPPSESTIELSGQMTNKLGNSTVNCTLILKKAGSYLLMR